MEKILLLIIVLLLSLLQISCISKSTEASNGVEYISNTPETRPPAPTKSYEEGEEEALYERLFLRVEIELQKYVDYDATNKKNFKKNVLFLLENYEIMDLDIIDIGDYITSGKYDYKDKDDKVGDKKVYCGNDPINYIDPSGHKALNRTKAVSYALEYCKKPNKDYANYEKYDMWDWLILFHNVYMMMVKNGWNKRW